MRKNLCRFLAFVICTLSIVSYAEQTDLQQEQENLKNQIQQSNENLTDVKDELSDNLLEVQKLDERISKSQEEVNNLDAQISELQEYVDKVKGELNNVEADFDKQREVLEDRLIAIYEAGENKYLDVILSSKSVSEFLSNYYLITQMAEYDKALLDDMSNRKENINSVKKELEGKQEELATIKQTQTKTAKILENVKKLRENYTAQLSAQEKEIQAQIDQYNQRFQEINTQILQLAQNGIDSKYIGGELAWPVPGYTSITSKYGMRTHPITGVYKLHTGADIGAPAGANFIAVNDGLVVKAEYNSAYGNMVIIDHGGGISTLYAHGSEILVKAGEYVRREQPILKVGSTGYSTGPHAHFEVRINGVVTDPMPYITNGLIPGNENTNDNN